MSPALSLFIKVQHATVRTHNQCFVKGMLMTSANIFIIITVNYNIYHNFEFVPDIPETNISIPSRYIIYSHKNFLNGLL